ncbi:MAG: hypothetical protein NZM43_11125 [Saprospiraceae bacterium]|nr:hypothetical protein [Saprospiraceae bacterium]MDW8484859.1 hypothetical protein [Saprospiraceae bacterium]
MFRRHTREPFPIRNIVLLSVVVLLILLYMLYQLKKAERASSSTIIFEPTEVNH